MIQFVVKGEPVSLKNNKALGEEKTSKKGNRYRDIVNNSLVKSYQNFFWPQVPWKVLKMWDCPVRVIMKIWYSSRKPDLDEAIILDLMQAVYTKHPITKEKILSRRGVYINDRQVDQKFIYKGIDKYHPRTQIIVEPIEMTTTDDLFDFEQDARQQISRGVF